MAEPDVIALQKRLDDALEEIEKLTEIISQHNDELLAGTEKLKETYIAGYKRSSHLRPNPHLSWLNYAAEKGIEV